MPTHNKERPILFSGPMIRAILENRKCQTRRVVRLRAGEIAHDGDDGSLHAVANTTGGDSIERVIRCPYGQPGDRLWVRETFRVESVGTHVPVKIPYEDVGIVYAADGEKRNIHREYPSALSRTCHNNKPSIFMPRWASRITLEVTGVRVERLREISEQDAIAEGVERVRYANDPHDAGFRDYLGDVVLRSARHSFETLWVKINGRESWDANPWVWVVEFRRVEK